MLRLLLRPGPSDLTPLVGLSSPMELRRVSTEDPRALESAMEDIDVVYHLAADTDATSSPKRAKVVRTSNVEGTKSILEAMRRRDVERLIFPSTLSVVAPNRGVAKEDAPLSSMRPSNPYARSKLEVERLIDQAKGSFGLRPTVLRMATVFGVGPRLRFHTSVHKFVLSAYLGEPLSVWKGAKRQLRPYLWLGDAVNAFATVLDEPSAKDQTFQVRTEDATVNSILGEIESRFGRPRVRVLAPPFPLGPSFRTESRKLAGLGFQYKGSLRRGIGELVTALRKIGVRNRRKTG